VGSEKFAGMYVHIPFCVRKCPYCDFYSTTDFYLREGFPEALIAEMQMRADTSGLCFDTLYFGGGTPSVLEEMEIARIMEGAYQFFQMQDDTEITIEANPGTVSLEKLRGYRNTGVNRINLGIQSFQNANLRFLGRIHSGEAACLAVEQAQNAGFDNIGLDLIYGLPGQTNAAWLADLSKAIEYSPAHLSCYMLTYESGTPMEKKRQEKVFRALPEDKVAELFRTTIEFLDANGYAQYEISNFSLVTSHFPLLTSISRHNQKYWSDVPYLGFGPSAHSFLGNERFWNHRSVVEYVRAIRSGQLPTAEKEVLDKAQQMTEAIYVGLRKTDGIRLCEFDEKFKVCFREVFGETVAHLEAEGCAKLSPNRFALTRKGMVFLDSITGMLLTCF